MRGRWYIEGYERFNEDGSLKEYTPKGIEIRTTPQPSIEQTISQLANNLDLLTLELKKHQFLTTWISYNPFKTNFEITYPYNAYELKKLEQSPEDRTNNIAMLTYGPDLNISIEGLSDEQVIDLGHKLTYYSPFIVPFSFSSPFYQGKLWEGLSVRTFMRTGERHAVRVFITNPEKVDKTSALIAQSRLPIEQGRIEFKAFDSCNDPKLYAGLLALLKGIILDQSLEGRANQPDKLMHQLAAKKAFDDPIIARGAKEVLDTSLKVLKDDPDVIYLNLLIKMLETKTTPAQVLINCYNQTGSISKTLLLNSYDNFNI